ncbi:sigma 54-interacting transcriptional regulator [Anaerospora sp.]|uniref:sigma 54-interacting transcriptional regulator n=1 Tax=Anaerospora sp. TaxID=1960278 RepID=UPI0028991973|nr:sigma 54-interacting transcriptional regulator [Anaerospora sp.]
MLKAIIRHDKGLHTRVAAMVVQKANELQSRFGAILYIHDHRGNKIPASSLLPLVSLHIRAGDTVMVSSAGGEQEEAAVKALAEFLESDFVLSDAVTLGSVDRMLQDQAVAAEQIFQSLAHGLLVTDEYDQVVVFNPAAARIMKLEASQVIGRPVQDVIPDTRLHVVNRTMTPELSSRQVFGSTVLITNRTPIIVDGEAKGAVAIFEDISSLENTMGELRMVKDLQERLHLILETVEDGICVVDAMGVITYVNPSYLRITGMTRLEVEGKLLSHISPHGGRARALATGQPVLGHISRKANGQTIAANVTPIIVDGEVTGVVSVIKNMFEVEAFMDKLHQVTEQAEYLKQELRRSRKPVKAFDRFIGGSGNVVEALAIAGKAAESLATVLIRGESGTGKELVAEGIHFGSPRAHGPFIRVNCAAIPSALLESELFGHERGAFTGAIRRKQGKFELAHGGTIFLDEIGDMEKSMQVKLLRVLQKREFQRLGGEETLQADVRIIAATNQDLEKMMAAGMFRDDLYYRLNVIPIFLPALRERQADIPLLAEYFLNRIATTLNKPFRGFRQEALEALCHYQWPGNVRELENVVERMLTLSDGPYIELDSLPGYLREIPQSAASGSCMKEDSILPWEDYEKEIIEKALVRYGSFNRAAKVLGLTHKTVAAKARKYGLMKNLVWEKRSE